MFPTLRKKIKKGGEHIKKEVPEPTKCRCFLVSGKVKDEIKPFWWYQQNGTKLNHKKKNKHNYKRGLRMDKQIEYKKLYENLSIKWYYIEELNEKLIQETIHLLELYLKEIAQGEEHQTAKYIYDCLYIYEKYDLCPMEIAKLIRILQCFFNFHCSFSSVFKIPDIKIKLKEHLKKEHARNLKNEIAQIKKYNKETEQEIKILKYKMQGVSAIKTDKVRLENATYNENSILNLIEKIDYLKQDIAYKNKLIEHLQAIESTREST